MSNTANKKAGFGQIIRGLAGGLLKAGFLITLAVYILNTFVLQAFGVQSMTIASVIGCAAYMGFSWRSTTSANRHESPDDALRDSIGDLLVFGVLLSITLIWSFLPNFSGLVIVDGSYYVTLIFFWAMFSICVFEAAVTISNSLYQMYRIQQIKTE